MDQAKASAKETASKIKNFFSKKKSEAKFKSAGPGRKLNADSASSSSGQGQRAKSPKEVYVPVKRQELTDEAKNARDAAMNAAMKRLVDNNKSKPLNVSLIAIKEQAKRELEEQRKTETESGLKKLKITTEKKDYATDGVFFACPLVSEEILPKSEWKVKIKNFLYEQLENDPGLTACLIIKNCNPLDKAEDCIETLKKYLQNIIDQPNEPKFQRIKLSNKIFSEKVGNTEGSMLFMKSAGFQEQICDGEEKFLIWRPDFPTEILSQLLEALDLCEVINLELDRNLKVLLPSQIQNVNLPPAFFRVSPEEIKREQQARAAAFEDSQILKTKAMRENDERRYARNFKYSLIRIRFPDGLFLQGTFGSLEKLSTIFDFVMESLQHESAAFSLIGPDGQKFSNEDVEETLTSLRLVPNATLKFAYESTENLQEFLKEELQLLAQPL